MGRQADPKEKIVDAFITAAWQNSTDEIIKLANHYPWLVDGANPYLLQALHAAAGSAQKDSARLLVEGYGADVNGRLNGTTPLNTAMNSADMVTARMLISHGADINAQDDANGFTDGWTPLHYAVSHRDEEMVRLLGLNYADGEIKNGAGKTAAQMARAHGDKALADIVDKATAKDAPRPLPMQPKKRPDTPKP